jgi:cobalamin biosynthesis Mg chelatase CobN
MAAPPPSSSSTASASLSSSLVRGLADYRARAKEQWRADAFYRAVSSADVPTSSHRAGWRQVWQSTTARIRAYWRALQLGRRTDEGEKKKSNSFTLVAALLLLTLLFGSVWWIRS